MLLSAGCPKNQGVPSNMMAKDSDSLVMTYKLRDPMMREMSTHIEDPVEFLSEEKCSEAPTMCGTSHLCFPVVGAQMA